MNVETVARNIQVIIAPVVMITACAILLQGLVNRYNALNDRMRAMTRERFDLLHSGGERDAVTTERLEELDTQLPDLLHRHKLVRDSVLSVYIAVMLYLASMFVIAFAALANSAE